MVSFWPWKGDDSSPASFEKTLSTLSAKISKTSSRLDRLRQRSRRLSVLCTLYAGFAYLLYSIILALVVGWKNWGPAEYAAVTGGPIAIYLIRLGLSTYYDHRTSSIQGHLDELQKRRDSTIEKLKTATKYDTTQELLKKYGGTPTSKANPAGGSGRKTTQKQGDSGTSKRGRTTFIPPPTANIPGRDIPNSQSNTPQRSPPQSISPPTQEALFATAASTPRMTRPMSPQDGSTDFAPNAFSAPSQYAQTNEGSRWYDRIMDVLLGEDETLPRARLALICSKCRLVNGQAPPGVKRLEDVGVWRCGGCGDVNGEENETERIFASIKELASSERRPNEEDKKSSSALGALEVQNTSSEQIPAAADDGYESDVTQYSLGNSEQDKEIEQVQQKTVKSTAEPETSRRRSTRPKGNGKKG